MQYWLILASLTGIIFKLFAQSWDNSITLFCAKPRELILFLDFNLDDTDSSFHVSTVVSDSQDCGPIEN
jgi:hypothetical protein